MSEEPYAISKVAPAPAAQSDYDAICAALMDTGRGRWFLEEYARRNRSADTQNLLAAIQRIETVVCAERDKQVQHSFRTDLLEMAKAITRTRAEVGAIRSDAPARPESVQPESQASPPASQARGVFAAAERIRDVAWAMRGHGFDPSTCGQIEELAASILSASSLRDPGDRRASKLSEVLQYLEHRIDALLESSADAAAAPKPLAEPDRTPPEPEIAPQEVPPEPDPSIELELEPQHPAPVEPPASRHGDTAELARDAEPAVEASTATEEPAASGAEPLQALSEGAGGAAQLPPSIQGGATAAGADPPDTLLPNLAPADSRRWLPASPDIQAMSAPPQTAARWLLPEIDLRSDLRDFDAAAPGGALPTASPPPEAPAATCVPAAPSFDPAADFAGAQLAALGPVDATGLEPAPILADGPPSPPATQPPLSAEGAHASQIEVAQLAATTPQLPAGDPLAALKTMSEEELIALFS
jgi:chemotaxis protein CheZ